jgi:hypothetical protein
MIGRLKQTMVMQYDQWHEKNTPLIEEHTPKGHMPVDARSPNKCIARSRQSTGVESRAQLVDLPTTTVQQYRNKDSKHDIITSCWHILLLTLQQPCLHSSEHLDPYLLATDLTWAILVVHKS